MEDLLTFNSPDEFDEVTETSSMGTGGERECILINRNLHHSEQIVVTLTTSSPAYDSHTTTRRVCYLYNETRRVLRWAVMSL